jgi:hypothetical protein
VFILKGDKVLCFDTLLQVFILKDLDCTKIVQNGSILWVLISKDFGAGASKNEQRRRGRNRERHVLARRSDWSAEFKG